MGVLKGRWPRAIFYDSKGTLFDWPWTWKQAAERIAAKYDSGVTGAQFLETWARFFEGFHRRAAAVRYTPVSDLIRQALTMAFKVHRIDGSPEDAKLMLDVH